MYYCTRLHRGDDLKLSIVQFCQKNHIQAAVVVSAVGCLYQAHLRLADGKTENLIAQRYEIVSLTGTISTNGVHLHISLADENGKVIGGHLCNQSLVNTTCELVIDTLDDQYKFFREYDEDTGYQELVIKE